MDQRSYLSLAAGLGSSVAFLSAVFALAFLAKLLTQGELRALYLLGFTAAAWLGGVTARYAFRALAESEDLAEPPLVPKPRASVIGQIMLLARSAKGRLSASEVAAATNLSVAESHQVLRGLIKEGVADIWINDAGGLVYVFPELLEDFKETAKSPFASNSDEIR